MDFRNDPFAGDQGLPPPPEKMRDILRDLWWGMGSTHQRLDVIDGKVSATNGRVSKLERFMWMAMGGLAVVSTIVVPLFLKVVMA